MVNQVFDLALTNDSLVRSAINAGVDFTIFAKTQNGGNGRLTVATTEGAALATWATAASAPRS